MAPLTPEERLQIRGQVSMTLANLAAFRLYWLPNLRRVCARSLSVTRRFAVPAEAVLVGEYEAPIPTGDVLADLEELLERLPEPAPLPEPQPDSPPPAAQAGAGEAQATKPRPTPAPHPWRAPAGS